MPLLNALEEQQHRPVQMKPIHNVRYLMLVSAGPPIESLLWR